MVPVDKAHVEPMGSGDNENVDMPQIAVQQSLRATPGVQSLCTLRQFLAQCGQPLEQAVAYRGLRGRRLTCFQCVDSVAHIGGVKLNTQITAVQPNFSQ